MQRDFVWTPGEDYIKRSRLNGATNQSLPARAGFLTSFGKTTGTRKSP